MIGATEKRGHISERIPKTQTPQDFLATLNRSRRIQMDYLFEPHARISTSMMQRAEKDGAAAYFWLQSQGIAFTFDSDREVWVPL